jgi:hypothetical protein
MDAPEKNLATKKPEDAQVETPETDAAEAEASAPALPEVPAYINQQRAEALRKNLESKVVPADKGLIYLASFPKSGNTWTRLFLFALFNPLIRQDENFNLSDIAGRAGQMDVTFQLFERILGKPHYEISDIEVAQTMPMAQKLLAIQQEKKVFVKTHLCNGAWHGTRTIGLDTFRTAVYIVRNPLDVTPSFASHMNTDIDGAIKGMANSTHFIGGRPKKFSLEAAIKAEKEKRPELSDEEAKEKALAPGQIPQLMGSWSEHVASWTAAPDPRVIYMRYEDMKHDPEDTFYRTVKHLGLPFSRDDVIAAEEAVKFDKIQAKEKSDGFKEKMGGEAFFRKGKTGSWREEMTDQQVRQVIVNHHHQMRRFNYIPEEYKDLDERLLKNQKQFAMSGVVGVGRKLTYSDKLRIKRDLKKKKKLQG